MARSWTDEQLAASHLHARSLRQVLSSLGLCVNGGNAATVKRHLRLLGLPVPRVVRKTDAQKVKEYRTRHPETVKAYNDSYRAENLDKFAQYARNRRALNAGASGSFTLTEFKSLCTKYGQKCLACGKIQKILTADHVKPLSKGGSNSISNIQPLCGSCNSKKHTAETDYRSPL